MDRRCLLALAIAKVSCLPGPPRPEAPSSIPSPGSATTSSSPGTVVPTSQEIDYLEYTRAVLDILEEGHYRAEKIDWTKVGESVLPVVQRRPIAEGAYEAIQEALGLVADPHTRFYTPPEAEDLLAQSPLPGPVPEGRRLEPGLGYLNLPGATFRFMDENLSYAQTVRTEMREIDADRPVCGWVVDLRENSGGSIPEHVAERGGGLGAPPLLGLHRLPDGRIRPAA